MKKEGYLWIEVMEDTWQWVKKKKPSKKLLKMAFVYDRQYGPHKWEPCAFDKDGRCWGLKAEGVR